MPHFPVIRYIRNKVGYTTTDLWGGDLFTYTILPLQQVGVDLEEQTLAAFQIPTDLGFSSNDSIELQTYDEEGQIKGRYYFFDEFWAQVCLKDASKTGWYDADLVGEGTYVCCNDTVLEFGQGVMLMSSEDDTTLTYAGQVVDEDQEFDLWGDDLFTYCGNCSAKQINLGDVAIPTDEGFSSNDSIELQTYDEEGQIKGRYYFFDAFWAQVCLKDASKTGWYDADLVGEGTYVCCNETVQLAIGEMFMVMSSESDSTITIPAAIKKGE